MNARDQLLANIKREYYEILAELADAYPEGRASNRACGRCEALRTVVALYPDETSYHVFADALPELNRHTVCSEYNKSRRIMRELDEM